MQPPPRKATGLSPLDRIVISLPPAWLRGGSLFFTALTGWTGFLALTGHDPALRPGARVAGALAMLGLLVPRAFHAVRRARANQRAELRRMRTLMATDRLPLLSHGNAADGTRLRGTLGLPLVAVAVAEMPLPVYEGTVSTPSDQPISPDDPAAHGNQPCCVVEQPGSDHDDASGAENQRRADRLTRRLERFRKRTAAA